MDLYRFHTAPLSLVGIEYASEIPHTSVDLLKQIINSGKQPSGSMENKAKSSATKTSRLEYAVRFWAGMGYPRDKALESKILERHDFIAGTYYAVMTIKGRWPELEQAMKPNKFMVDVYRSSIKAAGIAK